MVRKRKLDPYTSIFVDRHGKERCRFRRLGFSCYLPHPSTKGYGEAYRRALDGLPATAEPKAVPRTIGDLVPRFYESIAFKRGGKGWQNVVRQVLEPFRREFADDKVANFRPKDIEVILARKMEKRVEKREGTDKGRVVGGTAAAKRLREQLDRLFRLAVKLEWTDRNPVELADDVDHKVVGFFPWDEDHIGQFREFWQLGTKPRLALELVLWTGARRADARLLPPPKGGRIHGRAGKTGKSFDIQVAPPLQDAIDAMPAIGLTSILVTDYGKPFTAAGFGAWFKDKCIRAGLPQCTLHGLRKALARRAADQGVGQQGLKALGQWSGDREVAIYIAGADQRRLAEGALDAVIQWERDANIV